MRLSYLLAMVLLVAVNAAGYMAYRSVSAVHAGKPLRPDGVRTSVLAPVRPATTTIAPISPGRRGSKDAVELDERLPTTTSREPGDDTRSPPLPSPPNGRIPSRARKTTNDRARPAARRRTSLPRKHQRAVRTAPRLRSVAAPPITEPKPLAKPVVTPAPKKSDLTELEENPYKQQN